MRWLHPVIEHLQETLSHDAVLRFEVVLPAIEEWYYLAKLRVSAASYMLPADVKRKIDEFLSLDNHMSHSESDFL